MQFFKENPDHTVYAVLWVLWPAFLLIFCEHFPVLKNKIQPSEFEELALLNNS